MPEFERAITSDKVKRDNVFTWPLFLERGGGGGDDLKFKLIFLV